MKVKEFVEEYKKNKRNSQMIKQIVTTTYVPFEDKVNMCNTIVVTTMYKKNEQTGEAVFHVSSTAKHLLYTMKVIDKYTDLEIDYTNLMEEYDLLNSEGIIKIIFSIVQNDLKEFDMILDMSESDIIKNESSSSVYWTNRIKDVMNILDVNLSGMVDAVTNVIENLDEDKVNKVLKFINKR